MIKHVENIVLPEITDILAPLKEAEENLESESESYNDEYSEDEDLCEGFDKDGNRI